MRINDRLHFAKTKTEVFTGPLDDLARSCDQLEQSMKTFTEVLATTRKQINHEIGSKIQVERPLKESDEIFRLMLENSSDVIYKTYLQSDTF